LGELVARFAGEHQATHMGGGIGAWKEAGLPVVTA
jgi:rhodanese-related sulfurtransferase